MLNLRNLEIREHSRKKLSNFYIHKLFPKFCKKNVTRVLKNGINKNFLKRKIGLKTRIILWSLDCWQSFIKNDFIKPLFLGLGRSFSSRDFIFYFCISYFFIEIFRILCPKFSDTFTVYELARPRSSNQTGTFSKFCWNVTKSRDVSRRAHSGSLLGGSWPNWSHNCTWCSFNINSKTNTHWSIVNRISNLLMKFRKSLQKIS